MTLALLCFLAALPAVELVEVPAGTVRLGTDPKDSVREDDEAPALTADVKAFRMDRTPVTVAAFEKLWPKIRELDPAARALRDEETPKEWLGRCNLGSSRRDHPVNCVDHRAALAYCRAAGGDLPTEAEWEHAARAAGSSIYAWGERFDPGRTISSVSCGTRGCLGGTRPVVRTGPRCSPRGICDLSGNVWQYTRTNYGERLGPYVSSSTISSVPEKAAIKGGSWMNEKPAMFRLAHRGLVYAKNGLTGVGFRCVYRAP